MYQDRLPCGPEKQLGAPCAAHLVAVARLTTSAVLGSLSTPPSVSADPCTDVEVVFAPGTGEPPVVSKFGIAFVDSLRSNVCGKSPRVYRVALFAMLGKALYPRKRGCGMSRTPYIRPVARRNADSPFCPIRGAVAPCRRSDASGDRSHVCAERFVAVRHWPEEHADWRCADSGGRLAACDHWQIVILDGQVITVSRQEHYAGRVAA